ncbi:MAG: biotin--[acetyl-CoA-carboxylase] ligase [Clostridia bacterium]|nr:biotin--[acetyl-CoA-carboxylase] ligase [Clostridia bacterium]
MSIQSEIMEILEKNRGECISGAFLAEKFEITRSAIWKIIKSLQKKGHQIEAVTNRGYSLKKESNVITAEGISLNLQGPSLNWKNKIKVFDVISSTKQKGKAEWEGVFTHLQKQVFI